MTDAKINPDAYKALKKCRPDDLDNAPPPSPDDVLPSYPSGSNTKYPYNYETQTGSHKILIMTQDGHHGPDRWDLTQNDPGTPREPQHEHDDFKRLPPSILQDADPKDSRDALSVPGDQLGLTPEQRAAIKKQNEH